MKNRTKDQIKEFINEVWKDVDNIEVDTYGEGVHISLSSQYDPPEFSFSILKKVSKFFETDNIDSENDIRQRGCDSCDYGSRYGFTLIIKPMEK